MPAQIDLRSLTDEPSKYDRIVELEGESAWWDRNGAHGGLHLLNDLRIPYFEKLLKGYAGKRILDVGCGGGVFAEAAARLGANITAIDPSARSLDLAKERARKQGLSINYQFGFIESFKTSEPFDAIFAVDVLEHVVDLDASLDACMAALKPGGMFGFLTHNQTLEAFKFLIWDGEYHLRFIPKGNHDFHKFITPEDLTARLAKRGLKVEEIRGLEYLVHLNPPRADFAATPAISYIGYGWKR
jgi:2-polyprenyl-6-hydroxyphenyl methylase/3-demethylubiquinone-9 3-methyltransferase